MVTVLLDLGIQASSLRRVERYLNLAWWCPGRALEARRGCIVSEEPPVTIGSQFTPSIWKLKRLSRGNSLTQQILIAWPLCLDPVLGVKYIFSKQNRHKWCPHGASGVVGEGRQHTKQGPQIWEVHGKTVDGGSGGSGWWGTKVENWNNCNKVINKI